MPRFTLFHDFVSGKLVPYWFVMTFKQNEIVWDNNVIYVPIAIHLEYFNRDQYDYKIPSISVSLKDIVFSNTQPGKVGIYLKSVRKRLNEYKVDPYLIHQLIIPFPDTHDFLKFIPNKKKILILNKMRCYSGLF